MTINRPNATQLLSLNPQGGDPRWLGHSGHVSGLAHGWVLPGGCDQLTAKLAVEPTIRTPAINPGRIIQAYRGASRIWEGILQEPVPGADGWTLSAAGAGNYGTDYVAYYTSTWPANQPDEPVNNAIGRGLRWVNTGLNGTPGMWLPATGTDSAAQTVTDLLNLVCTYGGLTWTVTTNNYGNFLDVIPLPSVPDRLLVVQNPQGRTLGGDVNTIYERYVVTPDNTATGAAQVDGVTYSQNTASVAAHGERETYIDLTQAGVMSAGTAQGYGISVLQRYIRASWTGPITAGPGDILTMGGQPVDLGAEQGPHVYQLVLQDYGYGGEVALNQAASFLGGAYSYDDTAQTAQVTPFQYLASSVSSLLGAAGGTLPTATTALSLIS